MRHVADGLAIQYDETTDQPIDKMTLDDFVMKRTGYGLRSYPHLVRKKHQRNRCGDLRLAAGRHGKEEKIIKGTTASTELCEGNQEKFIVYSSSVLALAPTPKRQRERSGVRVFLHHCSCSFSSIRRLDKVVCLFPGFCLYDMRRNKYYWFWEAVTDGHLYRDRPICFSVGSLTDICISQNTPRQKESWRK